MSKFIYLDGEEAVIPREMLDDKVNLFGRDMSDFLIPNSMFEIPIDSNAAKHYIAYSMLRIIEDKQSDYLPLFKNAGLFLDDGYMKYLANILINLEEDQQELITRSIGRDVFDDIVSKLSYEQVQNREVMRDVWVLNNFGITVEEIRQPIENLYKHPDLQEQLVKYRMKLDRIRKFYSFIFNSEDPEGIIRDIFNTYDIRYERINDHIIYHIKYQQMSINISMKRKYNGTFYREIDQISYLNNPLELHISFDPYQVVIIDLQTYVEVYA